MRFVVGRESIAVSQGCGADENIGIALETGQSPLSGYRWLPSPLEGAPRLSGLARATESGISVEVAIPWSIFQIQAADTVPGATFDLNLSIGDNDGENPAQQSLASATPARTDHRTPTEWGTLLLVE